jgi:hypothetical protein
VQSYRQHWEGSFERLDDYLQESQGRDAHGDR